MTTYSQSTNTGAECKAAAWLIDLDGTLYRQFPVRLAMAVELLMTGASSISVIRRFRSEQELLRQSDFQEGCTCPYGVQISRTALALNKAENEVAAVVREWMERRPSKWLRLFRRKKLLTEIADFRERGGRTALVSDYPASVKLEGLGLTSLFEVVVACGEPGGPKSLKPSPEGFLLAAKHLGVEPRRCLVIGDRDDCDGEAARRAKMAFRLLK